MAGTYKHLKVTTEAISGVARYIPAGTLRTGTVTTVIGSKIITGVGTQFLSGGEVQVGDTLILDTDLKVNVIAVDKDTQIRVKEPVSVLKTDVNFTSEEFLAKEFEVIFTADGEIEGNAWVSNVPWKMKNDYGMESVLFNGTGTITYLQPSPNH